LEEQVETFRFAILNPGQDNKAFLQQSGYFLYEQLIQPAEAFLSKKSQLVILPDGILHYIPFEVLITSEPASESDKPYGKLSYFGKKYPTCYGQSASVYVSMVNDRSSSSNTESEMKELLAFGDPVYGGEYRRLEYSGEEIKGIASLFPDALVRTLIREEATEENAKKEKMLSEYKLLHFATHGVMDEKNPEKSGLVLSQENLSTEDGILRADEISELELNADLVVLSACQTGIGKMIRGEGMIGLSRSFMYAGAPSVVMSLWSVSDQSTNILMKRFYENLILKGVSKAKALQLARNSMIKDEQYAHPFFWAPFVLTGDWQ
jgi:CHAT domain-containing protein